MQPQRYQRSRRTRLPAGVVCVTRYRRDNPGKWGNPYVVGIDGNAEECVALFIELYGHDGDYRARARLELAGKHLACWCPPGAPCHADVLLQWANQPA